MSLAVAQTKLAWPIDTRAASAFLRTLPFNATFISRRGATYPSASKLGVSASPLAAACTPVGHHPHHGAGCQKDAIRSSRVRQDGPRANRWRLLHPERLCPGSRGSPLGESTSPTTPGSRDQLSAIFRSDPNAPVPGLLCRASNSMSSCLIAVWPATRDRAAKHYSILILERARPSPRVRRECVATLGKRPPRPLREDRRGGQGREPAESHWRRLARECGSNPKQFFERVRLIGRSGPQGKWRRPSAEVAAMPAGWQKAWTWRGRHAVESGVPIRFGQLRIVGGKCRRTSPLLPHAARAAATFHPNARL